MGRKRTGPAEMAIPLPVVLIIEDEPHMRRFLRASLRANGFHFWRIQTHGSAASVDEMCGPEGYADSFGLSASDIEPVGPRQGDGSYTVSLPRFFTTAQ